MEMIEDGPGGHADTAGNIVHGRLVITVSGEKLCSDGKDAPPGFARLLFFSGWTFLPHARFIARSGYYVQFRHFLCAKVHLGGLRNLGLSRRTAAVPA